MSATSLLYWEGRHAKTQSRKLELYYEITAAKTISPLVPGYPAITAFDAIASQSVIDDFLGTSSEFTLAQYDATAMGTDAFGIIVRMGDVDSQRGQADVDVWASLSLYDGTNNGDETLSSIKGGALSDSTLENGYLKGSNGNLGARFVLAGLDAKTSGILKVELNWISK